ncbi:MAG: phosphodiester glycosidase family protein [Pyrinomonadaceae bacterium]
MNTRPDRKYLVRGALRALLFLFAAAVTACAPHAPGQTQATTALAPAAPRFQTVAPGVEHLKIVREGGDDPQVINLLRVDLKRAELRLAHALDTAIGLETVSSLAARHGAVAGVNGGFFRTTGTYRGDATGALVMGGGRWLSEPQPHRAAVGLIERRHHTELVFGHLTFEGSLTINGRHAHHLDGLNRPRAANELVIYTPDFHRTTLTAPDGLEVVVRRGRVVNRRDGAGSSLVPSDGFIVSVAGAAREWARQHLPVGTRAGVQLSLVPADATQRAVWRRATQVLGGGPQLVRDGRVSITAEQEKVAAAFVTDRHPRTAFARLADGRILLATVDGRQPGVSHGFSLHALAEMLVAHGARDALNLDGGGSTAMVVNRHLANKPSDQTGERPVSDAILVFPRALSGAAGVKTR